MKWKVNYSGFNCPTQHEQWDTKWRTGGTEGLIRNNNEKIADLMQKTLVCSKCCTCRRLHIVQFKCKLWTGPNVSSCFPGSPGPVCPPVPLVWSCCLVFLDWAKAALCMFSAVLVLLVQLVVVGLCVSALCSFVSFTLSHTGPAYYVEAVLFPLARFLQSDPLLSASLCKPPPPPAYSLQREINSGGGNYLP